MAISKIITSSLTDDAVTSAKIGTDQVGGDGTSSSAISGVDIPNNSVGESELSDYTANLYLISFLAFCILSMTDKLLRWCTAFWVQLQELAVLQLPQVNVELVDRARGCTTTPTSKVQ